MKRYFNSVEGKLFALLGFTLSGMGLLMIAVYSERKIVAHESSRIEKYEKALDLLSSSILQFERDAEAKMWLAVQHLKHEDRKGIPSRNRLLERARELGMTHLFVIDREGAFLRSTNESPALIPNLYSFSEEYRTLLDHPETPIATPIIPPDPEIKPYKFLTVFHRETGRFLHAGLRADFLESALTRMVASDPEIEQVEIFSPSGIGLGRFERGVFRHEAGRMRAPELIQRSEKFLTSPDHVRLLHWTDSSHPDCSQCRNRGDLKDGRHQYLFTLLVSNEILLKWKHLEFLKAFFLSLFWCGIAMGIAFTLAKRFTRRIRVLKKRVEESGRGGTISGELELQGSDEIADLSHQFQALLDRIESHRERERQLERGKIELEIARQVAHDLRSPLTLLEVLCSSSAMTRDTEARLIPQALQRIREVANDLLRTKSATPEIPMEPLTAVSPHRLLESLVAEKRVEYLSRGDCVWVYEPRIQDQFILLEAPPGELNRALSNLLNNAFEAHGPGQEVRIEIELRAESREEFSLTIRDRGVGLTPRHLDRIGERGFTEGKAGGTGLGFAHAKELFERIGGDICIVNRSHAGAEVRIRLPRLDQALPVVPDFEQGNIERVIIVDDDPLIHAAWKTFFKARGIQWSSFNHPREFKQYYSRHFDTLDGVWILMDHEFVNEPHKLGLEMIEELGIESQALLVTGRSEDPELLVRALRSGVRIFPKSLLGLLETQSA